MHRRIIPDVVNNQNVCSLPLEDTAANAARQMVKRNIAAVVVVNEIGRMLGIVTERDLTRRVMAENLDPAKTTLASIMTPDPEVLSPDKTAGDALELMRIRSFRHLPVIDGDRVVAMVSIRDLYAAVKSDLEDDNHEIEAFVFGTQYGA